mmetsp:Transcript_43089/g.121875  ORF Transcript_43089/g.121875 Transcript_43089/m.121875 type:complete len:211 (+) Transcript_43089:951-1583(+)
MWPPLPAPPLPKGLEQNVAIKPRCCASSFTPVLNVAEASPASTPYVGAKVISSCPLPYSAFMVLMSTPTALMARSTSNMKPCDFEFCSVAKMSMPSKTGDLSDALTRANSSSEAARIFNPRPPCAARASTILRHTNRGPAPFFSVAGRGCNCSQYTRCTTMPFASSPAQGSTCSVDQSGTISALGHPAARTSAGSCRLALAENARQPEYM